MTDGRRFDRVLLVCATFLLVVFIVIASTLLYQVSSVKASSDRAARAATSVNDGIDKRTPAREKQQEQIADTNTKVTKILEACVDGR